MLIKTYPCFGICSYDSSNRPHAIGFGNETEAGCDGGFGEGSHLSWSQLLHLTLGEVTTESQYELHKLLSNDCMSMSRCRYVHANVPEGQVLQFGPHFLSVEPEGILLAHALSDIETSSNQAHNIAVQKPSQELAQDLCTV